MKEREAPLNFQITVTNVTQIGSKSMAVLPTLNKDYFITFSSQASSLRWKSPLIHGKVTRENTRFPWTFVADSHQLTVTFHELDGGKEKVVGSMPLMLMRREGEEQFLIFGCTEANRGRKVAEIDFTYNQCSVAASLPSNEDSKRASLQYTLEVENYENKQILISRRKALNMIPEQPEISAQKQTNSRIKMPDESLVDSRDFHPSRLQTLKIQSNRRRATEDSNFELNLIREMEDATDRWYRNNFGKEKPSDLEHCDIEDSRMVSLRYQESFQYLNELSYTAPHMELKNLLLLTDKLPQIVELYGIDLDGSQLLKQKVASMSVEGYRYNWPTSVRLPKDKKAYGLQVITSDKERLQGLIIKDSNGKHVLQIYDKKGKRVGRANYTLKEIRKIEIQTMEIVQPQPAAEEKEQTERQLTNFLDKSFLKTNPKQSQKESTFNDLMRSDNEYPFKEKYKLIKEIYLNRSREEHQHIQRSADRQYIPTPEKERIISNNAYLNRSSVHYSKGKNFRKSQYELDPIETQRQQPTTMPTPMSLHVPTPKCVSPPAQPHCNKQISQFIPQGSHENLEENLIRQPSQNLNRKIEELKKIGNDLGKKTKIFASKRFSKNAKYKTVIYNEDEEDEQMEGMRNLQRSDSGKQSQQHKKSKREPINNTNSNATASFQSLLVNNTFSKEYQPPKEIAEPSKRFETVQIHKEEPQEILPQNNISQPDSIQYNAPPISDESQEVPIIRHKTADQAMLQAMILQKERDIIMKRQQSKPLSEKANETDRKASSLRVNTERIQIINNVHQTSINPVPTTPTQKRAIPKLDQQQQVDEEPNGWEGKPSMKEDPSSMRESVLRHTHQSKYSSQTIQPTTQLPAGKINFIVSTITINYYQKTFGSKFVKVYVPNRHYYQTPESTNPSSFFWKCSGFLFFRLHDHQDVYLQLINSDGNESRMIGRVILNASQFKLEGDQAVIRAYLVLESKIVGQVVVGYQVVGKNKEVDEGKRQTVSLEHLKLNHSKKQTTPIKRSKRKKHRDKSLNDSLTNFLRKNRKDKINRYIINEYSRAHIDSRIVPSVPRKYTAGKNVVIGRDIRFPFSVEDEHKIAVPGPGAYNEKSEFQRYQ